MASFKEFCANAKSKLAGTHAPEVEDESEEEVYEEDSDTYYEAQNEAVAPIERTVSQYERDASRPAHASAHRSSGLDSLFTSTAEKPAVTSASETAPISPIELADADMMPSRERSYVGASPVASRSRQVAVINPDTYEEAEVVTKALRDKDVVVIDLRGVDQGLSRRFLDFSFGATSALNGKVDMLENRVYTISVGEPITQSEIERIKRDGLI